MRVDGVAGEEGGVEARDVQEERRHLFVLGFEAIGDLCGDADLVFASEPETLRLLGDLHEEPHALFLWRGICFYHFNETSDFRSEGVHGCRKDRIELSEVSELTGDVGGERV